MIRSWLPVGLYFSDALTNHKSTILNHHFQKWEWEEFQNFRQQKEGNDSNQGGNGYSSSCLLAVPDSCKYALLLITWNEKWVNYEFFKSHQVHVTVSRFGRGFRLSMSTFICLETLILLFSLQAKIQRSNSENPLISLVARLQKLSFRKNYNSKFSEKSCSQNYWS